MANLLRLAEVRKRTGMARSSIYRLIKKDQFPRPVKLGAGGFASAWVESEVRDWIEQQIARRDAGQHQ